LQDARKNVEIIFRETREKTIAKFAVYTREKCRENSKVEASKLQIIYEQYPDISPWDSLHKHRENRRWQAWQNIENIHSETPDIPPVDSQTNVNPSQGQRVPSLLLLGYCGLFRRSMLLPPYNLSLQITGAAEMAVLQLRETNTLCEREYIFRSEGIH